MQSSSHSETSMQHQQNTTSCRIKQQLKDPCTWWQHSNTKHTYTLRSSQLQVLHMRKILASQWHYFHGWIAPGKNQEWLSHYPWKQLLYHPSQNQNCPTLSNYDRPATRTKTPQAAVAAPAFITRAWRAASAITMEKEISTMIKNVNATAHQLSSCNVLLQVLCHMAKKVLVVDTKEIFYYQYLEKSPK